MTNTQLAGWILVGTLVIVVELFLWGLTLPERPATVATPVVVTLPQPPLVIPPQEVVIVPPSETVGEGTTHKPKKHHVKPKDPLDAPYHKPKAPTIHDESETMHPTRSYCTWLGNHKTGYPMTRACFERDEITKRVYRTS